MKFACKKKKKFFNKKYLICKIIIFRNKKKKKNPFNILKYYGIKISGLYSIVLLFFECLHYSV